VMKSDLVRQAPPRYADKLTVVGDLMADLRAGELEESASPLSTAADSTALIGLLPGSKAAKLAQGVPLALAVAEQVWQIRPQTRFVIPVAPTLDLPTLAKFADPQQNPVLTNFGQISAKLVLNNLPSLPYLETPSGLRIDLWTQAPAYDLLIQCDLCLTTIGANTAELGALAVPMIVLMPTQQLDAMRAWDGIPGLLANLPGVGTLFAHLINRWFLRQFSQHRRLMAWPNIWAGEEIVPELLGELQPQQVADLVLAWLACPEQLLHVRQKLQQIRGQPNAAQKLAQLAQTLVVEMNAIS
jgi:lipid A disaccharide synthetase